jgi:hypothetical protein
MNHQVLACRRFGLVFAAVALLALRCISSAAEIASYPAEIDFPGISTYGVLDPSMAQDPASAPIYMAYSAIDFSAKWPGQNIAIYTRLAASFDSGVTWADQGSVVDYKDVTLPGAPPNNAGTWISEVASVVYDPGAPKNQRWKTMFMHYLVINGIRHFEDLWIGLKMASSASGLAKASESKLFSGAYYSSANDKTNGTTRSPLAGKPVIALDTAYGAELNGCIFGEPGLMATDSALYLAIVCNKSSTERKVALLKCASPCVPTTASAWQYLGSTLDTADAASFGYDEGFSAPDLVSSGGRFYVIVTPQSSDPWDSYYNGCMVVPFDNIDTATIARATGGAPEYIVQVAGTTGNFSGACTWLASAPAPGIVYGEITLDGGAPFRMYMSGVNF